jgi:Cu(I)/Ag(I) efflux system membrane fusion protein
MKRTALQTVQAARDKLRLWGLTAQQIQETETRGKPTDHMTIFAPNGGIVVEKHVTEGMYVAVGARIYTIADLSRVWVLLDAYESDISWIRYGQEVEFETEAYPGEIFRGRITFIDPVLNAKTRTVKVRVNVDNHDYKLKPEMFVRAVVRAHVAGGGRVMDPQLSGKWICPMHPEVVEDRSGTCRECGMELVKTESLGYVAVDKSQPDLMVPASAVLVTGKRAVVYVAVPHAEQPTYEGREIVIGPRAGDYFQVKSGLEEGERVVVHGGFKIDSALQIQARPSMMSPEGGVAHTGHAGHASPGEPAREGARSQPPASESRSTHGHEQRDTSQTSNLMLPIEFTESLSPLFDSYFSLQEHLARDDLAAAVAAFDELQSSTRRVRMEVLSGPSRSNWMRMVNDLDEAAKQGGASKDLDSARRAFASVSTALFVVEEQFGHPGEATHYRIHCPMAFDGQGADWMQTSDSVSNPYFGSKMARCGVLKSQFAPREAPRVTP